MKPIILTLTVASMLLCGACSSAGEGEETPIQELPQTATMEVVGADTGSLQSVTRALPISSGSIGVFLSPKIAGEYDIRENVEYEAQTINNQTVWNTSSDPFIFTAHIANVCAYYPYVKRQQDSGSVFNLKTQLYTLAADLAYSKNIPMNSSPLLADGTEAGAGSRVKFTMRHAYSLLDIGLVRGNIKGDAVITQFTVTAEGLKSDNTVDISTGTYGTPTSAQNNTCVYNLPTPLVVPANQGSTVDKSILMIPTGSLKNFKLTLKLKDGPTMSVSPSKLTSFIANNRYVLKLSVNATSVDLSSISVHEGWDEEKMKDANGSDTLKPEK